MKAKKLLILGLLVSIIGLPELSAQSFSPGIGLAIKASTNGIGGDAVYSFHKKMDIRLGFETMGFKTAFNFDEQGVAYAADVKFKTGSISLLYDFYVAKIFFVTAGAGYNLFNVGVLGEATDALQFGDIAISPDKIGKFDFTVGPSMKISPYLGIGLGRALSLDKKVGFAFELGGFYQGSPDITATTTGLLSPTSNPDQGQVIKLEKQISQYNIYPVLKFSLSYKIVTL